MKASALIGICAILLMSLNTPLICRQKSASETTPRSAAERAVDLALNGHCPEAMPLLDEAMRDQSNSTDTKRTVSLAGVRCSMLLNQQNDAMSFLGWLQQAFPRDPDVLFLAVHVFSDLSQRNSQDLMNTAPDSPLVIQLNAENFERQGDFQKAIAEYRILLQRVPNKPGIHYRIGGLLMSQSGTPASADEARKEFEEELKINPRSAGAEYYLGELAQQANNLSQAIEHFSRATTLYPAFAEAYAGLGRCLLDSDRTADALSPLESAVKLAPDNPTAHFALATAYQRLGRKDDAAREFALQKSTSEKLNQTTKTLHKNVSGVPVDSATQ
ncbi:MAG: tetratricopeptide repeat protein [Acidobacteriaceae bacterium]|nr:tetratricopeptide repeat protein [Acidobacteriaceae bacterium]MBV9767186.1 tetratricopeptide repeat protein [Acidobacteriaceae bacterium]